MDVTSKEVDLGRLSSKEIVSIDGGGATAEVARFCCCFYCYFSKLTLRP